MPRPADTARPAAPGLIGVAIVDDHAAVRLGLQSAIGSEPGLACVAVARDGDELTAILSRTRPDVVVLDYRLPGANGLALCRQVKADACVPAVLLYSAYADASLIVPAHVAGADAIVAKGAPASELLAAIHAVARGAGRLPAPSPALLEAAGAALDVDDLPILGMLVEGTPRGEIAATLGCSPRELEQRVGRMLARLRVRAPRDAAGG